MGADGYPDAMVGSEERPGAQEWVPPQADLEELRDAAQGCQGCELHRDATQTVMGRGAADAPLVALGEQPGDQEDQRGEPFVGPSGTLLVKALGAVGIAPSQIYRTNVVKHFRWSGTRGKQRIHQPPTQAHVRACSPWLSAELSLVSPRGVLLLGATAGKAVYGTGFRVGEVRGSMLEWPTQRFPTGGGVPWVLATIHPSAVLRADDRDQAYDGFVADLRVAAARLAEG